MKPALRPVRVWDLPTRGFHWLLAACVLGSVITAKVGGNAMVWHFRLGYVVLTLLLFRVLWGLVGGHWSRFTSFVRSPATVWRHVRGQDPPGGMHEVGHNPLGALSVLGLLAVLAVQVSTGLVADDEIANAGPLVSLVSGSTSSSMTTWHKSYGQWLVIGLVILHVSAILFYLLRKGQNLTGPMWSGDKLLPPDTPASADAGAQRLLAAALLGLCAGLVAWVIQLGGGALGA
jgi:cytochrome b